MTDFPAKFCISMSVLAFGAIFAAPAQAQDRACRTVADPDTSAPIKMCRDAQGRWVQ